MNEPTNKEPVVQIHQGDARIDLPLDPSANTKVYVDASLGSLKSEMRLWFIVAIVGNQFFSHVALSTAVGYIGGGGILVAAVAAKAFSSYR